MNRKPNAAAILVSFGAMAVCSQSSRADEGGVSFWLPGQYASLTATTSTPGWSFATMYYHANTGSAGNKVFPQGTEIRLGIDGNADLAVLSPNYVFEAPVLGGQAAIGVAAIVGYTKVAIDGTLTRPQGTQISGSESDSRWGYGDLYPTASLRWNQGVHSYVVYMSGDIPVGEYDADRLANFGIGHAAIDGGAGYTYFNTKSGYEFSVLAGVTYNYENDDTHYQNGIDGHIDWGWSRFLSAELQVGVAGYIYHQLSGDSGSGATLGDFKSKVLGVGPQIGKLFPVGNMQGYLSARGYYEFAEEHRPAGWNLLITFAVSPPAGE